MLEGEKFVEKIKPSEEKMNEKNPTPQEELEKERRKTARLMEILRENGIDVDSEKIEK